MTTTSSSDAPTAEAPVDLADPGTLADPVALDDLSSAELQAHARETWLRAGGRLTGAELAQRYGRSERWGRQQIAAAREQAADAGEAGAGIDGMTAGGNGSADSGAAARSHRHGRRHPPARRPEDEAAHPGTDAAAANQPSRRQGAAAPAARAAHKGAAGRRQPPGRERPAQAPLALLVVTAAAVVVVTLVCAVVSYTHIRDLAQQAGMGSLSGWLPLGIDGLVVAASCSLIVDRHLDRPGHPLAWAGVALGPGRKPRRQRAGRRHRPRPAAGRAVGARRLRPGRTRRLRPPPVPHARRPLSPTSTNPQPHTRWWGRSCSSDPTGDQSPSPQKGSPVMHTLTTDTIAALLRQRATGSYADEAAVELLIATGPGSTVATSSPRASTTTTTARTRSSGSTGTPSPPSSSCAPCSASEGRILRLAAELSGIDTGCSLVRSAVRPRRPQQRPSSSTPSATRSGWPGDEDGHATRPRGGWSASAP